MQCELSIIHYSQHEPGVIHDMKLLHAVENLFDCPDRYIMLKSKKEGVLEYPHLAEAGI